MDTEGAPPSDPVMDLVNALTSALRALAPASGSPMAMPASFTGEAAECSGFLLQVQLFIQRQPQLFPSEDAKVAFLISLLSGKALNWAKAVWNNNNPIIHSFEQFSAHFSDVFSTTSGALSISDQILRLRQGSSSVSEYTLQFRTLAAASGWGEVALLGAYRHGLNPDIIRRQRWFRRFFTAHSASFTATFSLSIPLSRSSVDLGGSSSSSTRTHASGFTPAISL